MIRSPISTLSQIKARSKTVYSLNQVISPEEFSRSPLSRFSPSFATQKEKRLPANPAGLLQLIRKPLKKVTYPKYENPVGSDEFCVGNSAGQKQLTRFGILMKLGEFRVFLHLDHSPGELTRPTSNDLIITATPC